MNCRIFCFLIIIVSISLSTNIFVFAQQNPPSDSLFKDEPSAHALYDKMLETLWNAETFYYESEYIWESKDRKLGHGTYKYWAKKPNFARLEAEGFDGKMKGTVILDGESIWIYWPTGLPFSQGLDSTEYDRIHITSYMQKAAPVGKHSIAHQIQLLAIGLAMPVLNPSLFHKCTLSMEKHLDGVRSLGVEKVGEEECELIEVSYMNHQRSKYLWISNKDNLPRKLKEIVRVSHNIITRELWANVIINSEIPLNLFNWNPPDGWVEYFLPQMEDGLLKTGTEAPDFDLTLIDGSRFKLSDYRGKVVWLVFWRVGCPPCRYEFPHLEKLYKNYKEAGLVVLGFNCSDDKDIALKFLQEYSATFPNIVDSSKIANDVFFSDYQKLRGQSAVPLNYIIDKDGKIADSWYGYKKVDERGIRTINILISK